MLLNFKKMFYKSVVLTGIPSFTYNPFRNSHFLVDFTVLNGSAYFNYKLNQKQVQKLNNSLSQNIIPVKLYDDDPNPEYYISVNVYKCKSPLFEETVRCEVNTYVENGTVILDYSANLISIDPVHYFKFPSQKTFMNKHIQAGTDNFTFHSDLLSIKDAHRKISKLHESVIQHTEKIFYTNDIYDRVYYDSSFIEANIVKVSTVFNKTYFLYNNMEFSYPDSVFYFNNNVDFVVSMWHNLNID